MRITFSVHIDGYPPILCSGTVITETETCYHVISDTTFNRYVVSKADYKGRRVVDWDCLESL